MATLAEKMYEGAKLSDTGVTIKSGGNISNISWVLGGASIKRIAAVKPPENEPKKRNTTKKEEEKVDEKTEKTSALKSEPTTASSTEGLQNMVAEWNPTSFKGQIVKHALKNMLNDKDPLQEEKPTTELTHKPSSTEMQPKFVSAKDQEDLQSQFSQQHDELKQKQEEQKEELLEQHKQQQKDLTEHQDLMRSPLEQYYRDNYPNASDDSITKAIDGHFSNEQEALLAKQKNELTNLENQFSQQSIDLGEAQEMMQSSFSNLGSAVEESGNAAQLLALLM